MPSGRNGLWKECHPGVFLVFAEGRLASWRASGRLPSKALSAFQSLTSMASWKDKTEQRRPVLPAPLAGLLSWPFSVKDGGGAGSKLKNTEKEFKLHVKIWIIASVGVDECELKSADLWKPKWQMALEQRPRGWVVSPKCWVPQCGRSVNTELTDRSLKTVGSAVGCCRLR